jgi:hypothetical protein
VIERPAHDAIIGEDCVGDGDGKREASEILTVYVISEAQQHELGVGPHWRAIFLVRDLHDRSSVTS